MNYYLLQSFYPNPYEQFTGFRLDFSEPIACFHLDKSVKTFDFDFFKSMDNYFIGSGELCEVLIRYNPAIQLTKCEGFFANHQPLAKPYFIIEYAQKSDVMDYQLSAYSGKPLMLARLEKGEPPSLIRAVKKLVIKEEFDKPLHYFFLKNTLLSQPIISQAVFDELLKLNLKIHVEKIS